MQFPYYYTPVAGNYSPAQRDAMFAKIQNADTPGNLASYNGVLALAPRPNLIINGYFVGGGSQLGSGQLPINQRRLTQYTNSGYSIDGWSIASSGSSVTIDTTTRAYTTFAVAATNAAIFQKLKNTQRFLGKTLTLSTLLADGNLYTATGIAPASVPTTDVNVATVTIPNFGTFQLDYISISSFRCFLCAFRAANKSVDVVAAKLEEGITQTLAHQENGVWVPNEIPRYNDELWKCQAYFQVFKTQAFRPTYGMDFRPPMATEAPTLGSFELDGVTYYTASSEP